MQRCVRLQCKTNMTTRVVRSHDHQRPCIAHDRDLRTARLQHLSFELWCDAAVDGGVEHVDGAASPLEHLAFKVNDVAGAEAEDDTRLLEQLYTTRPLWTIVSIRPDRIHACARGTGSMKRGHSGKRQQPQPTAATTRRSRPQPQQSASSTRRTLRCQPSASNRSSTLGRTGQKRTAAAALARTPTRC